MRTWPHEKGRRCSEGPVWAPVSGGPAVVGKNVYLLDRDEKVGDTLRVLDLASGKEQWTFAYEAPGSFMFAGSRTTPTVDGELVYTVGPMQGIWHAISTKTRTPAWRKNIWKDFGGAAELPRWGIRAESAHLRRSADRRDSDRRGRRRGRRQADRRAQGQSAALAGSSGLRDALDRQASRRGPVRHGEHVLPSVAARNAKDGSVNDLDLRSGKRVELCQPGVHHPGEAVDAGEGRVLSHGRLRRGLGDDQGGAEGRLNLRRVRALRTRTLAPTPSRPSCTRATSTALHDQRAERRTRRDEHGPPDRRRPTSSRRSSAAARSSPTA